METKFITKKNIGSRATHYDVLFWQQNKEFDGKFRIYGGEYIKTYLDEDTFLRLAKDSETRGLAARHFSIIGKNGYFLNSDGVELIPTDNNDHEIQYYSKFLDTIEFIQDQTGIKWDNLRSDMPIAAVSTKTYGDERGYPVAYRQHLADSHCNLNHGYNMKFHFEFECCDLDERNWCVDYGSLRSLRDALDDWFDHKTLVSESDPKREVFENLAAEKLASLTFVEATGCEALARFLWDWMTYWLEDNGYSPRVRMRRVEVRETVANMAYVTRD